MIIAPYSTDAPIYHLPIATGGLILTNIAVFFATTFQLMRGNIEVESIEWLILQFNTINPFQWISGAFMHDGFMHLIGNMFFLWAFGLVVEGKIGSIPFLGLYLAIAAVDGAAVQLPMFLLGSDGGALGASGVIFALMIVAMLWAPENEMDCFYFIAFRVGTFEIRIVKLAATFVMLQLIFLWLGGFSMSSEMLHVIGAAIGLPVGLFMLRQNLVDCEGWDVISRNEWMQQYDWLCTAEQRQRLRQKDADRYDPVSSALAISGVPLGSASTAALAGTLKPRLTNPIVEQPSPQPAPSRRRFLGRKPPAAPVEQTPDVSSHPEYNRLTFLLRQSIQTQSVNLAEQHYARLEQLGLACGLSDKMLMSYVGLLAAQKKWAETLRPLAVVVSHQGDAANQARIRIAQIQLKVLRNPRAAAIALGGISVGAEKMTPENQKLLALRDQLLAQAGNR